MKRLIPALLLAGMFISVPGLAQYKTGSDYKRELLDQISKARGCPSETALRAISPKIDSYVTDIINNRTIPMWKRLAAVDCMAHFRNKRSRQVLSSMLTDPTWDHDFRKHAMRAGARAFGEEFLPELRDLALSRNPATRSAAVKAIGEIGTQQSIQTLKSLQTTEVDLEVITALDEALSTSRGKVVIQPE